MSDKLLESFQFAVQFAPEIECAVCQDECRVYIRATDRWLPCPACMCIFCRSPLDGGCSCHDDREALT